MTRSLGKVLALAAVLLAFSQEAFSLSAWIADAPPPLLHAYDRVRAIPDAIWIALLLVWLILGIAFRATPFRLLPDDPWTLQSGRGRRRIAHSVGSIAEVRVSMEQIYDDPFNGNGFAKGMPRMSIETIRRLRLFIRPGDGENALTLTNDDFDVRQGHRILEVFDPKSQQCLFLYNCDLKQYQPAPFVGQFVKMRPWLLLPVWLLAMFAVGAFAPHTSPYVFFGAPLLYLALIRVLNSRRGEIFMRDMAPKMVAAANAESTPAAIGAAELDISLA